MTCNINYSDYEMEKYSEYMTWVENEIKKSDLPLDIKIRMLEHRNLHKRSDNTSWFLEELGYELDFQPFRQWLLQEERNKKLEILGVQKKINCIMTLKEKLELFKNKVWTYNSSTGEITSHKNNCIKVK